MIKRYKGIGIVALILSLCLYLLAAVEARTTSNEDVLSSLDQQEWEQQEVLSESQHGLLFEDALHRQNINASDWQQELRKLPVPLKMLVLLSLQEPEQTVGPLCADSLLFSLSKDLPVSYRNLRI